MHLLATRYIQNLNQYDLQKHCGVSQTVISHYESKGIDYLKPEDKENIELYLEMKINWDVEEQSPLSKSELKDLRFFVENIRRDNGKEKTFRWLESFGTSREAYTEAKRIINKMRASIPMSEIAFDKGEPNGERQ